MRWLFLFVLLAFPVSAQTTLFPTNGMARWCWSGTAWIACTNISTGHPPDKFPVNGRASWCYDGTNWVGCTE